MLLPLRREASRERERESAGRHFCADVVLEERELMVVVVVWRSWLTADRCVRILGVADVLAQDIPYVLDRTENLWTQHVDINTWNFYFIFFFTLNSFLGIYIFNKRGWEIVENSCVHDFTGLLEYCLDRKMSILLSVYSRSNELHTENLQKLKYYQRMIIVFTNINQSAHIFTLQDSLWDFQGWD